MLGLDWLSEALVTCNPSTLQVHIGYLPNKRVLGLSKLARWVNSLWEWWTACLSGPVSWLIKTCLWSSVESDPSDPNTFRLIILTALVVLGLPGLMRTPGKPGRLRRADSPSAAGSTIKPTITIGSQKTDQQDREVQTGGRGGRMLPWSQTALRLMEISWWSAAPRITWMRI